jgi:cell division protein FtsI (penicillin-binding protein 3)
MIRLKLWLTGFLVWSAVIAGRLAQFTVVDRQAFLERMTDEAWEVLEIPGIRGRLLDRQGTPLAWSTRHFQLVWQVPESLTLALPAYERMHTEFRLPIPEWDADALGRRLLSEQVLIPDLDPETLVKARSLESAIQGVRITSVFTRHLHPTRARPLARLLGQTTVHNGEEVGVSGLERTHDSILRGKPGQFRIMRDKHGQWRLETFEVLRTMVPGHDVYLPFRFVQGPGKGEPEP